MTGNPAPEVWLRGQVPGVAPDLQPVAHALLQTLEDVERAVAGLTPEQLWREPGGAASAGFHLLHLAGSIDRLATYERGEPLSAAQRRELALEKPPHASRPEGEALVSRVRSVVERVLEQLRATPVASLDEPRGVGRAGLPSNVRGLLFHAAEHGQRHAGQLVTTARVVRGLPG